MPPSRSVLQTEILKLMSSPGADTRLGRGRHYMAEIVRQHFKTDPPSFDDINEVLWSMLGQGLLHIDMSQPAPENWRWRLSSAGRAARTDADINPDDPQGYLSHVRRVAANVSGTAMMYLEEALLSYTGRRYLASAVMLGVAAEAAFMEMAQSFGQWLPGGEGVKFVEMLDNPKQVYLAKFAEFRKRLEPRKPDLPRDLADGMALTLDSVLDVLRIYRNDAGHPTGKTIDREDALVNLQMAARVLQKLYALKAFFDKKVA